MFNTWAPLYAQLVSLRTAVDDSGEFTIVMDDVDASIVIPAGAYDMDRTSWIGVRGFSTSGPNVAMAEGSSVTNLLSITGCTVVQSAGNTTPNITLAAGQTLNLYATTLIGPSSGTSQLLFITGGAAVLRMSDDTTIQSGDGTQVILIDAGSTLTALIDGALAQLLGGTIVGNAATFLNVFIRSESGIFSWPQIFFAGTFLYVQQEPYWGGNNGNPNGILTGARGAIYDDLSTSTQFQNTDGATTWVAFGGVDVDAVIFDNAVPTTHTNIRSARLTNQSPIDNTKAQITNLGSQDHTIEPTSTGATGVGATIGGGDDNTASGDYSTVPGGSGNFATNFNSYAEGGGSVASGDTAHAEGNFTTASGLQSHSEGNTSLASGDQSHAEGNSTTASGSSSHAEGLNTTASANQAHAEGNGSMATAAQAHAEGNGSTAIAAQAHAEGLNTIASGVGAHAEGHNSTASGSGSHAEGDGGGGPGSTASGFAAHAEGAGCTASGDQSHAGGAGAVASRSGQWARSSGGFGSPGKQQTSMVTMASQTPGLVINEAVELLIGGFQQLILADGSAYTFKVTLVAGGTQPGPVIVSRSIEISFNARRDAGLTVITASGPAASYGDATTATWTLVATVGAAPDRIVLTFNTGVGAASATFINARVDFTETLRH